MPRATNSAASRQRRKKVLARAKGFRGSRHRLYRTAATAAIRAAAFAYRDRRTRKRDFRRLWIVRIGAAARDNGLSYSRFMNGLKRADVEIDRKVLADLAVSQPQVFASLAETAKAALTA